MVDEQDDSRQPDDDLAAAAGPGEGDGEADEAFLGDRELPTTGLLSFYDRLRERIVAAVEERGGRLGEQAVRALLVVPDVFILLVRLLLDRRVPASSRALIGGALAYFVLPVDLLPEAIVGAGGYVDDLVLAAAVLAQVFAGDLEPYARRHWSGSEDLRVVLRDITATARSLLGAHLYDRLGRLLARRGIALPEEPGADGEAPPSGRRESGFGAPGEQTFGD